MNPSDDRSAGRQMMWGARMPAHTVACTMTLIARTLAGERVRELHREALVVRTIDTVKPAAAPRLRRLAPKH